MPYGNGDYRMTIILPNLWQHEDRTIDDIIALMSDEKWPEWTAGNAPEKFDLVLPKFKFEYEVSLNQILQSLGMDGRLIQWDDDTVLLVMERCLRCGSHEVQRE